MTRGTRGSAHSSTTFPGSPSTRPTQLPERSRRLGSNFFPVQQSSPSASASPATPSQQRPARPPRSPQEPAVLPRSRLHLHVTVRALQGQTGHRFPANPHHSPPAVRLPRGGSGCRSRTARRSPAFRPAPPRPARAAGPVTRSQCGHGAESLLHS